MAADSSPDAGWANSNMMGLLTGTLLLVGRIQMCLGLVSNDGLTGSAWQKAEREAKEVVGAV